jgi:serine/threonine protein phosphatase PrpC
VGESVVGTSHIKVGQPGQDAHHWSVLPDGTLVAAVADGAGSATLAEVGATLAAQTAVKFLTAALAPDTVAAQAGSGSADIPVRSEPTDAPEADNNVHAPLATAPSDQAQSSSTPEVEAANLKALLADAVKAARAAVEAEAAARQVSPRELSCTLLLALARPGLVAAAQIGDGAVVVADSSGQVSAVTTPSSGEYLNETTFLTSPDAFERRQLATWRGELAHWAMLTDGLQMLALKIPGGEAHAGFFTPLFAYLAGQPDRAQAQAALGAFLRSPRVTAQADDDLTLMLATLVS